jgi:hypothetical protein
VFKPAGIDANGTGNALTLLRWMCAALQINYENLFAGVQLLFKLFWGDPCKPKLAHNSKPPDQLRGGVDTEPSERKNCHKRSRSGSVSSRPVQFVAEDIAKSGVGGGIEGRAKRIKAQETESAAAGCPGQGRQYRVQSRDELGHHEKSRPMPDKVLSRPALGGVRIWREAMNEVQNPIAPPPTRLEPRPVGYYTGTDSQTESGDEAQTPGGCQSPGRNQKHRSRYRQTQLVHEYRNEQDGVSVLGDRLDDSIHIKITPWAGRPTHVSPAEEHETPHAISRGSQYGSLKHQRSLFPLVVPS